MHIIREKFLDTSRDDKSMSPREIRPVSEVTLRRLPAYYHFLRALRERGREVVSCSHIGAALRLDPTQVRKDLEATGVVGRPKVGYQVAPLIDAITTFLGWNNSKDALLVGVGNMGSALLGYEPMGQCGVNILAGFDTDPAKIGTTVHGKEVFALDKFTDLAGRMNVHLGIITVPAQAAQAVAQMMVDSGIRAIWNFAPTALQVPENVVVQDEDFYPGLAVLSSRMAGLSEHAGHLTTKLAGTLRAE
jgi:redox-sensing transcriptional repressor